MSRLDIINFHGYNENMDRQEYLNQISAANRPMKKSRSSKIFGSKFFWVGAIGIVSFVIIIVIGAVISGSRSSEKDRLIALMLRVKNTSEIIDEYRSDIKSSKLRSDSATLSSVLSATSQDLNNYAVDKYNYKEKNVKKDIDQEETLAKDDIIAELFNAKINGNLDSAYATKIAFEISLIEAREAQIINAVKDATFKETLTAHYNSIEKLYNEFSNFSE